MSAMTGTDAHRWQAGAGAIAGALLADAKLAEGTTWGRAGEALVAHAEQYLAGAAVVVDLAAGEAIGVAVGLSSGASPLLADSDTVALIDLVRAHLVGGEGVDSVASIVETGAIAPGSCLDAAARIATSADAFDVVVDQAMASHGPEVAFVSAALWGLAGGLGALPARPLSQLVAPDGRRGRRYLTRLTDRLLGLDRNDWFDPRGRRGPTEVLPGLWLSNIHGLDRFVADHPSGLVLSLCDIEGRIDHHRDQITFHVDDTPKRVANPSLDRVLDEVLHEISLARGQGRPVLVHCRHGASRTGLILRLVVMAEYALDPAEAVVEAQCLWPSTSTWNTAWAYVIERRQATE